MQYYSFTAEIDAEELPPHIRPAYLWEVILKDPYAVHTFANDVEVAYYLGDSCQNTLAALTLVEEMILEHIRHNVSLEASDE